MIKILFLVPYPLKESPSQRFRFEQYFQILEKDGHRIQYQSFFNSKEWRLFYSTGNSLGKLIALLKGFSKRAGLLIAAPRYDFIFIHREACPIGPPVFEWVLGKILRKKIIYDFDDAIWLSDRTEESAVFRVIKWRSKVASICRWSYKVSCGNRYLADYAKQFNSHVVVNPTTIDTEQHHNQNLFAQQELRNDDVITIGWTGSHSTLKYLSLLEPVLKKIEMKFPQITFLVIADRPSDMKLSNLKFLQWNAESEIKDLLGIDIGIMPLPNDEWAKGKCGFKALQYMALEIPAVVSPVGVNSEIITNGVEGFLCDTEQEWLDALEKLILDGTLRKEMGTRGREKVVKNYSVISNSSTFLSLFT